MKQAFFHILLLCLLSGCGHHGIPFRQEQTNPIQLSVSDVFFLRSAELTDGALLERTGMAVAVYGGEDRCVLLTNKHLVHGAGSLQVALWTDTTGKPGERISYVKASCLYESKDLDAALIEIPATAACTTAMPADTDPAPGTEIVTSGQPVRDQGAMTRGIVSGYWPVDGQGRLMVSDMLTTPGFSGSGVFLAGGRLAGLVTGATGDPRRGFAYIIPVSRLRGLLAKAGHAGANQPIPKKEVQHHEESGHGKKNNNDPGAASAPRGSARR